MGNTGPTAPGLGGLYIVSSLPRRTAAAWGGFKSNLSVPLVKDWRSEGGSLCLSPRGIRDTRGLREVPSASLLEEPELLEV